MAQIENIVKIYKIVFLQLNLPRICIGLKPRSQEDNVLLGLKSLVSIWHTKAQDKANLTVSENHC